MFGWFKLASREKRRRRALVRMINAAMELARGEGRVDMKTEWANESLESSISFLVAILAAALLDRNLTLDSDALRKLMAAIEEKIKEAKLTAYVEEGMRRRCDG